MENFIKKTINKYNQQNLIYSEKDQPFDETVPPFWQMITENATQIPDELWESVPSDASEKLDYYLYNQSNPLFLTSVFPPAQIILLSAIALRGCIEGVADG